MSLEVQLTDAFAAVGADTGQLQNWVNGGAADLNSLSTTAKSNLVVAINELVAAINALPAVSDGTVSASALWSSSKIQTELTSAINGVLGGAPAALDTLNELAAALADDADFATTITASLGNKVDYSVAQTLTATQKSRACTNIGVGNPETNFLAVYTTNRDA